ncbi:MAG TPA: hypothetical protein VK789_05620, partial [Bryobacteraceae bacterium]|nr:hypothetical protein [Bryobacteraceae bacterium]
DAAIAFVTSLILYSLTVVLIIRFGLLTLAAWLTFQACLVENFPFTTQSSSWYAGISLAGILLMAAVASYCFYTSLGRRPILGSAVLEE